jgi:hypothetical protein
VGLGVGTVAKLKNEMVEVREEGDAGYKPG